METKGYIGCKRLSDGKWVEYGISAGWNNTLMLDSYGGVTIGGAGIEVDGNGIFPFSRLTNSKHVINNVEYYTLGILDNAYHSFTGCDSNSTYSWFIGLLTSGENNIKDNAAAKFVVMYNDTDYDAENEHYLDNNSWHIVFQVGTNGV